MPYFVFASKTIAIIDKPLSKVPGHPGLNVDILIISKNPAISIPEIHNIFKCKQILFDASNSNWKIAGWKKECAALDLPYYVIAEKGAFVMILN
jgi:competence protein ComEC